MASYKEAQKQKVGAFMFRTNLIEHFCMAAVRQFNRAVVILNVRIGTRPQMLCVPLRHDWDAFSFVLCTCPAFCISTISRVICRECFPLKNRAVGGARTDASEKL
jgi:hypothetical protein